MQVFTSNLSLRADLRVSQDLPLHFRANGFAILHNAIPEEVARDLERAAREQVRQAGTDVRHGSDGHVLSYTVVTGELIYERFSELFAFYTAPDMRKWVAAITGAKQVYLSKNLRSAVNINCMRETGQIYRWHFDAIPYTAVLFLTTSTEADGGALDIAVCHVDKQKMLPHRGAEFSIVPRAGTLLLMDGTRCLHRAAPLMRNTLRLTVPMVYPVIADDSRPDGLDEYLYQPVSG